MAELLKPLFVTLLDSDGNPVSGGYIKPLVTGTTTPATVYADAGLMTPAPVGASGYPQADAAGRMQPIYLDPTVAYRIQVWSPGIGTPIRDIDPANDTFQFLLSGSTGAGLVGFSQTSSYAYGTVGKTAQWVVQVSDAPFGAKVDGATNDTAAVQAAYDALVSRGGGLLVFPVGTTKCNISHYSRLVSFKGVGRNASFIVPWDVTKDAINIIYRDGSWYASTIEDIGFGAHGSAVATYATGIGMGSESYVSNDQLSTATIIRNCGFAGFDKSIQRHQGQIGLWVTNSTFEAANFHFHTVGYTGSGAMHGGAMYAHDNHIRGAALAAFYFDSPVTGSGAVSIYDNIVEGNPGFLMFIKNFYDGDRAPGFHYARNWNEANYTAGSVTIDGNSYTPGVLYAANTPRIRLTDTPLGPLTLVSSSLILDDCDVGDLVPTIDSNSSITVYEAGEFGGNEVQVVVRSMRGGTQEPGAGVWYPFMPATASTKAYLPNVSLFWDASATTNFNGSAVVATTAATAGDPLPSPFGNGQELAITTGQTLYPATFSTAPTAGQWCVLKYIVRLKSGTPPTVALTGNSGQTNTHTIKSASWQMITALYEVVAPAGTNTLYHTATGNATIVIGAISHVAFDNRNDALEYANAPLIATT